MDLLLTWYGGEIDNGRDHGAQANKDPESEDHGAPGSGLVSRDRAARAWKSKPSREGTDCPMS